MDTVVEFFLDPLRLTLVVSAVVVLLAIVLFGRISNRRHDRIDYYSGKSQNKDFSFGVSDADVLIDEEVVVLPPRKKESEVLYDANITIDPSSSLGAGAVSEFDSAGPEAITPEEAYSHKSVTEPAPSEPVKPRASKEQFVVLHVIAADRKPFSGKEIFEATQSLGLAFGKHHVFHYPVAAASSGESKFCLVNMSQSGSFDPNRIEEMTTKGVSLIMRLPIKNADGLTVFSNMLPIAQALARRLKGEILDQTREPLTPEVISSLRTDIARFENSLRESQPVPEV